MAAKEQINRRFGAWTVIAVGDYTGPGNLRYLCRCLCGKEQLVRGSNLHSGASKRCSACAAIKSAKTRAAAIAQVGK